MMLPSVGSASGLVKFKNVTTEQRGEERRGDEGDQISDIRYE